eukprot:gene16019-biopygen9760
MKKSTRVKKRGAAGATREQEHALPTPSVRFSHVPLCSALLCSVPLRAVPLCSVLLCGVLLLCCSVLVCSVLSKAGSRRANERTWPNARENISSAPQVPKTCKNHLEHDQN